MPYGRILVDTGVIDAQEFAAYDEAGNLVANMRAVGIDPGSNGHIFLTDAHVGHSTVLIYEEGTKVFPNATGYMSEIEHAFRFSPNVSVDDTDGYPEESVIFGTFLRT